MPITVKELFKGIIPLSKDKAYQLAQLEDYLDRSGLRKAKNLLKQGYAGVFLTDLHVSKKILPENEFPVIRPANEEPEVKQTCAKLNNHIKERIRKHAIRGISKNPWNLLEFYAGHLVGMDPMRKAGLLQLFSDEPIHILLLGDPGTGKTDLLRATEELAQKASFGLGSGTSGVGLTVTFKGNEMIKGLLPQADEGICCIDELNLMKEADFAALYNAMEKGFITYNKGNKQVHLEARVQVLATANPKGDRFIGNDISLLKNQMPFDPALLSRFHLVFLIRGPSLSDFKRISQKIVRGKQQKMTGTEREIVKEYIEKVGELDVVFPKSLQDDVVMIGQQIKKRENKLLIEVSPRLIHGIVRLCRAHARLHGRSKVTRKDLEAIDHLLTESLAIRKESR